MSTELSIIVCVVVGNPVWRVMEFVATLWFPGDGESDRSLCIQPVSDISSAELLLGLAPRPDSQTWASSCEPSVRCVRSQRGGRTLITAALSRHWFPLSFPWSHTCLSATCLPLPLISTQSAFSSCLVLSWRVKSINSSRRTDTHQWGSCVMSCPDAACHWECEKKKFSSDWTMLPCSLVPNPPIMTWVFVVSLQMALAPKPQLKKVRNLSYWTPVILPVIIPGCPENLEPGVEDFYSLSPLLGYFHLQCNTSERIFPWKLL